MAIASSAGASDKAEELSDSIPGALDDATAPDEVGQFRPAILAVRAGTTAISLILAASTIEKSDKALIAWCAVVAIYNLIRLIQPLRYTADVAGLLRVLGEVALHVVAVTFTGRWESPLVFALITAVMVAGFARGFGFALRIGLASAAAVSLPLLVDRSATAADVRLAAQWAGELVLVGLIAGYARRVTGEADRQHTLALDRLGRLADANMLLHSLHRVAQTLPASLDIEDVLDTTLGRLRDLFDYHGATIMLLDETDRRWVVARWDGPRPAPAYSSHELPAALRETVQLRLPVLVDRIAPDSPGVSVEMASGLYAPLMARESMIGLIALEHRDMHHFRLRDQELLDGFVEPAALAVDNARWFARLRTVGADEERTRIARDLHDRIGQSLAYLAFELDRIVKADSKGESVTKHLERLRTDVRGVIGEVRDTLYDLRTDVTEDQDMTATLRAFVDRVGGRTGLETSLEAKVTGRLPIVQERELWRIAQEAITNVERHARANRLAITWRCDGNHAVLVVADNGVGFPDGRAGRLDSYGIIGMRERAASIGAALDVASEPGAGTTVRCEVRAG